MYRSPGSTVLARNDFSGRGEYMGALDGCAIDFEVASTGVAISDSTFYHTYASGIMIFGHHGTTARNFSINRCTFINAGCTQLGGDHGEIALTCPDGAQPVGVIANNSFQTCPNVSAIARRTPACGENVTLSNNNINTGFAMVSRPQLEMHPPDPQSTAPSVMVAIVATTPTPNATLRYTLDGSRPTEASAIVPAEGVALPWPGQNVALNVRGFAPGFLPSVTEGTVLERRLYQGGGLRTPQLRSMLEAATFNGSQEGLSVHGWAVDPLMAGAGVPPVTLQITLDFAIVAANITASLPRPDLVKAKVAPNPDHGFSFTFPANMTQGLRHGRHLIGVQAIGCPSCSAGPVPLIKSPLCLVNGQAATTC